MPTTRRKPIRPKASEVTHAWRLVDAEGQTLGRLATQIAGLLRASTCPRTAEHMDMGDFVVVVNARAHSRHAATRPQQRFYYRHSTYPGGLKAVALGDVLAKHPDRVIKHTVRGMLPHNALGPQNAAQAEDLRRAEHPHAAQFRAYEKQQRARLRSNRMRDRAPTPPAGGARS